MAQMWVMPYNLVTTTITAHLLAFSQSDFCVFLVWHEVRIDDSKRAVRRNVCRTEQAGTSAEQCNAVYVTPSRLVKVQGSAMQCVPYRADWHESKTEWCSV
eukprot:1142671-Pelagomonas_calceolata.AAC.3